MSPTRPDADRSDDATDRAADSAAAEWLRATATQLRVSPPPGLLTGAITAAPAVRRRRRLAVAIPVAATAFAAAAIITATVLLTGGSPTVSRVSQPLAGGPAGTVAATTHQDVPGIFVTVGTSPPESAPTQSGPTTTQSGPHTTVPPVATSSPTRPPTAVPNVVGTSGTAATSVLRAAGFTAVHQTGSCANPKLPAGTVLAQQPAAGTRTDPSTAVTLTVTADCVEVPNVVGTAPPAAKSTLESAGFQVWLSGTWNCPNGFGNVTAQSPAGATAAVRGGTVSITYACATSTSLAPSP